jgi:hypothetical protein
LWQLAGLNLAFTFMRNQIVRLQMAVQLEDWNPTFKKHGMGDVENTKGDIGTLPLMPTETEPSL